MRRSDFNAQRGPFYGHFQRFLIIYFVARVFFVWMSYIIFALRSFEENVTKNGSNLMVKWSFKYLLSVSMKQYVGNLSLVQNFVE